MKRTITVIVLIYLLASGIAHADEHDGRHNLTGYYKSLLVSTQSTSTQEELFALTNRLRIKYNHAFNDNWQVYVALDNELILSDAGNTSDFAFTRSKMQDNTATLDWDKVSSDTGHRYSRHAVYRAYIKYYSPKLQAVIGKQAIDWGKMRFYSPIDLFNTPGPIDIEHDERVGADAINLNYAISDFSGINLIYIPGDHNSKQSYGAKIYKTIGTYDISLIAAEVRHNVSFGIAFDGYIKQAGLRGEITHNIFDNNREFARASIGVDYNVNDKIYILMEHFYNGGADDNDAASFLGDFNTARELLSLKKHLTSLWVQYKFTPLIDFNTYLIYDWEGESLALNPEVKYSLSESLDLTVGGQFFWGKSLSEFDSYNDLYYLQIQWYF